ncbi:hypothetical protein [Candidatus Rhabdochlamydia sp. W815]|nr:hypothetical protein [Candidatus Rhabdochlamydia sp. W815]
MLSILNNYYKLKGSQKKNSLALLFVIHKKFKDDPDIIRAAAG